MVAQRFFFFFALIAGLFLAVPTWEFFKPFLQWFVDRYHMSMPGGVQTWIVALSPVMVYFFVVALLLTVFQGILLPFFQQNLEEWIFRRWQRTVNGRNREDR